VHRPAGSRHLPVGASALGHLAGAPGGPAFEQHGQFPVVQVLLQVAGVNVVSIRSGVEYTAEMLKRQPTAISRSHFPN
jgi:hypothetical protein